MANRALHAGRRRCKGLRHLRIQHLRDGIDDLHVIDRNDNRLAQILITLDVRGHADLMDHRSDHRLHVRLPRTRIRVVRRQAVAHFVEPFEHCTAGAGLQQNILHTQRNQQI